MPTRPRRGAIETKHAVTSSNQKPPLYETLCLTTIVCSVESLEEKASLVPHPSSRRLSAHARARALMQHAVLNSIFLTMFITWLKLEDYGEKAADYCGGLQEKKEKKKGKKKLSISQLAKSKRNICLCIPFDMSGSDANSSAHPITGTRWLWVPQTLQASFHHPAAGVI